MNYKIEAINILLNKECILERYFPLIGYREVLLKRFKEEGIITKDDVIKNNAVLKETLKDEKLVSLFKLFLNMYETKKSKLKEIEKLDLTNEEKLCFSELYLLPGVKSTRANLYCLSSLKTLKDIASKSSGEIMNLTKKAILENKLDCKEPLLKEIKTHIAVAKLLTEYLITK